MIYDIQSVNIEDNNKSFRDIKIFFCLNVSVMNVRVSVNRI